MQDHPILVIGATGKTGARVAAKLEAKACLSAAARAAPPRPSTGNRRRLGPQR
jgi:uncharacterized protein YbjT (DUF2867 family)